MAPLPNDQPPHYDGGSPLDGGGSPSTNLGGNSGPFAPSGMEIGVIVGIVVLVVISVITFFVWRNWKARAAKDAEPLDIEAGHAGSNATGTSRANSKKKRSSTVLENSKATPMERRAHNQLHPVSDWDHWGPPHHQAEEYEITNRV